ALDNRARLEQVAQYIFDASQARNIRKHFLRGLGVGTRGQHLLLRFAHLGSRNCLHRFGNLRDIFDRSNTSSDFSCTCQGITLVSDSPLYLAGVHVWLKSVKAKRNDSIVSFVKSLERIMAWPISGRLDSR